MLSARNDNDGNSQEHHGKEKIERLIERTKQHEMSLTNKQSHPRSGQKRRKNNSSGNEGLPVTGRKRTKTKSGKRTSGDNDNHDNDNDDDDDDDDDGERTAATTTTGGDQLTIHQALTPLQVTSCMMALVSLSGAQPFSSCPRQRLTLSCGDDNDKRLTVMTVKNAIDGKSWWTLTG